MKTGSWVMGIREQAGIAPGLTLEHRCVGSSRYSPLTRSLRADQPSPEHVQIRQRKGGEQPGGVLGQSPVAHFGESPQPLNHMESMLTARPGAGAAAVDEALVV